MQTLSNVIVLDNGEDYEWHLINSGYEEEMVQAICEHEGEPEFVNKYINTRNHTSAGRERTDQPECPLVIRQYIGILYETTLEMKDIAKQSMIVVHPNKLKQSMLL